MLSALALAHAASCPVHTEVPLGSFGEMSAVNILWYPQEILNVLQNRHRVQFELN